MMKKIFLSLMTPLAFMSLVSCTGLGFDRFRKPFTRWFSEDDRLEFEIQGILDNYGLGTILVNEVEIPVAVLLDHVNQELVLFRYEDLDENFTYADYLVFQIVPYRRNAFAVEEERMKLISTKNNTGDETLDSAVFDLYREDLDPNQFDAKEYAGTSWKNEEYGLFLVSNRKSDFTKEIPGTVDYQGGEIEVEFLFLENERFEIRTGDEVLLTGTYATEDSSLILVFENSGLFEGISSLTLEAYEDLT